MRSKDYQNRQHVVSFFDETGALSSDEGYDSKGESWIRVVIENAKSTNSIQIQGKLKDQADWQSVGAAITNNSAGTTVDVKDYDLWRIKSVVCDPNDATTEIQKVAFDLVPDAGAWKITLNGHQSASLAFDISAAALQTALRLLAGFEACTVTGDFTSGFSILMTGYVGNVPVLTVSANTLEASATPVVTTVTTPTPGTASTSGGVKVIASGFYT